MVAGTVEDSAQSGNYSELHPKLFSQVYPQRTDDSKPVFTVVSPTAARPVTQRWLEGVYKVLCGCAVEYPSACSDTSSDITEPQRHKPSASERIQSQTCRGSIPRYLESHRYIEMEIGKSVFNGSEHLKPSCW